MLTDSQLRLLAETLSNIGIVLFGSLVIPLFTERFHFVQLIFGLILTFIMWFGSLIIIKKVRL